MSISFRITEYPIKVLKTIHASLIGVSHLQATIKIDYGFADINTDDGPCTMFRVPITTKITGQNGAIVFQLETRNNYDIYGFTDNPDIETLKSCINQAYVEHCKICKKEIMATPFVAIPLPAMDTGNLIKALKLDLLKLYNS